MKLHLVAEIFRQGRVEILKCNRGGIIWGDSFQVIRDVEGSVQVERFREESGCIGDILDSKLDGARSVLIKLVFPKQFRSIGRVTWPRLIHASSDWSQSTDVEYLVDRTVEGIFTA